MPLKQHIMHLLSTKQNCQEVTKIPEWTFNLVKVLGLQVCGVVTGLAT